MSRPGPVRFWEKVEKTDTCWLWRGRLHGGYGHIRDGVPHPAHRYSLILHGITVPEGMIIDHLCRVRHCVNPAHLEVVTIKENVLRGVGITASARRQTHCKNGHEFTPDNTYLHKDHRYCRECNKVRCKKYKITRRGKVADVKL